MMRSKVVACLLLVLVASAFGSKGHQSKLSHKANARSNGNLLETLLLSKQQEYKDMVSPAISFHLWVNARYHGYRF